MFYNVRESCWRCVTVSCLSISSGALTGAEVLWSGRSGCWQTDSASRHGNYLQPCCTVTIVPWPWPLDSQGHRVNDQQASMICLEHVTQQIKAADVLEHASYSIKHPYIYISTKKDIEVISRGIKFSLNFWDKKIHFTTKTLCNILHSLKKYNFKTICKFKAAKIIYSELFNCKGAENLFRTCKHAVF